MIRNYYKSKIFPKWMSHQLSEPQVNRLRSRLLSNSKENILEIGFGTGLNLLYYPETVHDITAIDVNLFECKYPNNQINLTRMNMSADSMSFPDACFSTIVSTFTLCSIKNIEFALTEIKRVMKNNGKFLFLEHSRNQSQIVASLQDISNPLYNWLACGCNVNRDVPSLLRGHGFKIESLESSHTSDLIVGYYVYGIAQKNGEEH